jgi:transcriptional regulator with XRE-family HTH domain
VDARRKGNGLGRLLRERRVALGYSRARVAEVVGIKAGTLEGWELGRVTKPPVHDVLRLARFLGISADEVEAAVLGDPPSPRKPTATDALPLLEQALALLKTHRQ